MERKLENGKLSVNALGVPQVCTGQAALLQLAENRLQLRRGAFPYLRTLGSRLHQLDRQDAHAAEVALRYAQEAFLGCPALCAESAQLTSDGVKITVRTPFGVGDAWYREEKAYDG